MEQLELPLESDVTTTLNTRGDRYGNFATQASLSQYLRNAVIQHFVQTHPNGNLPPFILEGISMICHKLARIANGDPLYIDTWRDISGYSQLVVDILKTFPGATDANVTILTRTSEGWE
jgi:hypothetical protein